jgi:hypothetical protein
MLTKRQAVSELLLEHMIKWGTAKDISWGEAKRLAAVEEARRQAAAMRIQGLGRSRLARNMLLSRNATATKIQSVCRM